jgi:hypothetical protein
MNKNLTKDELFYTQPNPEYAKSIKCICFTTISSVVFFIVYLTYIYYNVNYYKPPIFVEVIYAIIEGILISMVFFDSKKGKCTGHDLRICQGIIGGFVIGYIILFSTLFWVPCEYGS